MISVYYDGLCGLCSKEIAYYQRIAPQGIFNWQDVNQDPDALLQDKISLSDALRLLHAKDDKGTLHIGVDAFILIWRELKYWRLLAFVISLPIIRQIAAFAYEKFAAWRFAKLSHCQIALAKNS